jgi:hypothetical protein
MDYKQDKVDEMVLALLFLTMQAGVNSTTGFRRRFDDLISVFECLPAKRLRDDRP